MSTSGSVVVHGPGGAPVAGMSDAARREQFEREGRWADWIRNDAGDVSGWHHHAANETYVYVSRGSITFEFGEGGAKSVVAGPGDFVIVPAHTVHRELTGSESDLEAFVIRVGSDPEHVDAGGPVAPQG